jgi:heme/copper-type cytochrome/quinol oxidase subunit 2
VQPRVIELTADKDNTFKPKSITVKAGEKFILRVTSHFGGEQSRDGYQHSITIKKLKSQGWDLYLKEGTQDFPVTAPTESGTYEIICNVKCGKGHDDMKMKLIVTP